MTGIKNCLIVISKCLCSDSARRIVKPVLTRDKKQQLIIFSENCTVIFLNCFEEDKRDKNKWAITDELWGK